MTIRAFVVRPFTDPDGIDVRRVHDELIGPVLDQLGFGDATIEVDAATGCARAGLLPQFLDADLVIADVSGRDLSLYHEVGARHARRPRGTVLLRAVDESRSDPPHDVGGLPHLPYPAKDPASAQIRLMEAIRTTLSVGVVDSPVFRHVPDLPADEPPGDPVPPGLAALVEGCRGETDAGDLRLLADDVAGARFEEAALRLVAEAQAAIGDADGASGSWERVRVLRPHDVEAHVRLAALRTESDPGAGLVETERALAIPALRRDERVELLGLGGRAHERLWAGQWAPFDKMSERRRAALRSPSLDQAIDAYAAGFELGLDRTAVGLAALALVRLQLLLAEEVPDVWASNRRDRAEADRLAAERRGLRSWLEPALLGSLEARHRLVRRGALDPSLAAATADLLFLVSDDDERVLAAHERAAADADAAAASTVLRRLETYERLGFRSDLTARISAAYEPQRLGPECAVIVFAGRDGGGAAGAAPPPAADDRTRAAVREAVDALVRHHDGCRVLGFASASDDASLLFVEVCRERGIGTELFLPSGVATGTPCERSPGGVAGRIERYAAALEHAGEAVHVLDVLDVATGSPAAHDGPGGNGDRRWVRWVLHHASARAGRGRVEAVVLWDGRSSDGPDGVDAFVDQVRRERLPLRLVPSAP